MCYIHFKFHEISITSQTVLVTENVFPPVMCRRLLPNTVAEGERVVLEIEVAGTPEPTVSWFKNNQPLSATSTLYRLRQQGSCSAVVIDKGNKVNIMKV